MRLQEFRRQIAELYTQAHHRSENPLIYYRDWQGKLHAVGKVEIDYLGDVIIHAPKIEPI